MKMKNVLLLIVIVIVICLIISVYAEKSLAENSKLLVPIFVSNQQITENLGTPDDLFPVYRAVDRETPITGSIRLTISPELDLYERDWRIYSVNPNQPAHYIADSARVVRSLVNEGCQVYGTVENTVLFPGVVVGAHTVVRDSVIMSDTVIGSHVRIERAILGEECHVEDHCQIGRPGEGQEGITVLGENVVASKGKVIPGGFEVNVDNCETFECCSNGMTEGGRTE